MTDRQRAVLEAVLAFWADHGYAPTVRDLARAVGQTSPASVHRILGVLRDEGLISWNPQLPRTIRPVDRPVQTADTASVPLPPA